MLLHRSCSVFSACVFLEVRLNQRMAAGQQMLLNLGSFGFVAANTPYGQQHFKIIAWSYKASVWGWEIVKLAAGIVNQMQQFAFCSYLDPVVVGAAVLQAATFFFPLLYSVPLTKCTDSVFCLFCRWSSTELTQLFRFFFTGYGAEPHCRKMGISLHCLLIHLVAVKPAEQRM